MKKKIIVFIILSTVILIGTIYLLTKKQEKVIESDYEIKETIAAENGNNENETVGITNEEILDEIQTEEIIANAEGETKQEENKQQEKVVNPIKTTGETSKEEKITKHEQTTNIITVKEEPKNEVRPKEEPKQEEQSKEQQKIETIVQEQPTKEPEKELPVQTPKEENKQEESNESVEKEKEETKIEQENNIKEYYIINEKKIEEIRTVIKNNETEDMKKYGYEIVVDSTIPELTNEFTFTEKRVINKITWSCGVIKIYARDYYFNGKYVSTQCFIL